MLWSVSRMALPLQRSWNGAWPHCAGWALRAAILLAGYGAMLALLARTDTFYWALIAAPLSFAGLVFVPKAITDLAKPIRSPRGGAAS